MFLIYNSESIQQLIDYSINIIKEFVKLGNRDLKLLPAQWTMVEQLTSLLKKSFEMTKKLQYADITPGYFYRKCSGLLLFNNHHGAKLADSIAAAMKRRESELMQGKNVYNY